MEVEKRDAFVATTLTVEIPTDAINVTYRSHGPSDSGLLLSPLPPWSSGSIDATAMWFTNPTYGSTLAKQISFPKIIF